MISIYGEDFDYPKEIHQTPPLEMLLAFAEKEFRKKFSKRPTYAVYAPACVTTCGEITDFSDGKVLSMVKNSMNNYNLLVDHSISLHRLKNRLHNL